MNVTLQTTYHLFVDPIQKQIPYYQHRALPNTKHFSHRQNYLPLHDARSLISFHSMLFNLLRPHSVRFLTKIKGLNFLVHSMRKDTTTAKSTQEYIKFLP